MFHNQIKYKLGTSGFSLPGVLVGVGLLGISATIVSQTVINSRQTQKVAKLKLLSNKFQQAALNAVTDRVKDFVLEERCSGARWGGSGTTEVEKAFSELPLTTDSVGTTSLKFTKSPDLLSGNADVKERCRAPVSLGALDDGEYMRFCMEVTPTRSVKLDYRLLELLIVPVDLASDKALKCGDASGAAAGIKVTWQMYDQIDNSKVRSSDTNKTVLTESGTFLVSAETQSYSGTCNITAARVGTSDQCTINVSGLGRRPPTLKKNETVVTGFSWTRAPSTNYDAFTATTTCEKALSSTFKAQSAAGSDACEAAPVPSLCVPCGNPGNGCYDNADAIAAKCGKLADASEVEYKDAGSDFPSWPKFQVWKEKGGSRVLQASGIWLTQADWQKNLAKRGISFTSVDFSNYTKLAGRVCPTNVFLSYTNMTATGLCMYWSQPDLYPQPQMRLDEVAGTLAEDYLNRTNYALGGTGAGTSASWYEGNINYCSKDGMRLPTIYETKGCSGNGFAGNWPQDATPVFSPGKGIPCTYQHCWTASAFKNSVLPSSTHPPYWKHTDTYCADPGNYGGSGPDKAYVRCVLPGPLAR